MCTHLNSCRRSSWQRAGKWLSILDDSAKLPKGNQSHNIAFVLHSYIGEDTPGSWSGSGVGDSEPDIWAEVVAANFYGMGRDLVVVSQIAISNNGFLNTGKSVVPSIGVNGDLMLGWSFATELFYVYLDSVGDKMPGPQGDFMAIKTLCWCSSCHQL